MVRHALPADKGIISPMPIKHLAWYVIWVIFVQILQMHIKWNAQLEHINHIMGMPIAILLQLVPIRI